jgi:Fe-S cluster biogenesis protein NfuA
MTIEEKVETALQTIRPYLNADGGDVRLIEITPEKVVLVEMTGSCESCKLSAMTIKGGLEQTVKHAVPEITAVKAVNVNFDF